MMCIDNRVGKKQQKQQQQKEKKKEDSERRLLQLAGRHCHRPSRGRNVRASAGTESS